MRSRILRTFVAAAAAGATAITLGLATTAAASASVTKPAQPHISYPLIGTTSQAGYEASGRYFRYISATLTVPDTSFLTGLYPQEYIQLSNGSLASGDQYVPGQASSPASWPGRTVPSAPPAAGCRTWRPSTTR